MREPSFSILGSNSSIMSGVEWSDESVDEQKIHVFSIEQRKICIMCTHTHTHTYILLLLLLLYAISIDTILYL